MICGFNCVGFDKFNSSHYEKNQNDCSLKDFIVNKKIDAKSLQENIFPIKPADIFISHSHKDENIVHNLKSWLKEKLKLTSFLDSDVWGSADAILKQIDNSGFVSHYGNDKGGTTYSYEDRNLTTSYVHVMLCNAIMQAFDACKFVFFINTPNSINAKASVEDKETNSPWIFYELGVLKYIRKKEVNLNKSFSLNEQKSLEKFINFPTFDLTNLSKLTYEELNSLNNTDAVSELLRLGNVL